MRDLKLLVYKWTTSKAERSYGWNICSLYADGVKMSSTCGGGYDMQGRAVGDFIQDEYQERLLKLHRRAGNRYSISPSGEYKRLKAVKRCKKPWSAGVWYRGELYGLTAYYKRGQKKPFKMSLDGGCGMESMKKIARNIGITTAYHGEGFYRKSKADAYILKDSRV